MFRTLFSFSIALLFCLSSQKVYGQSFFTQGTEFWVGFLNNLVPAQVQCIVVLSNSQSSAVSGTVSLPGQGWEEVFTIPANGIQQITIPTNLALHTQVNTIVNRGVRILADAPITAYAYNLDVSGSSDATIVMPYETLSNRYTVVTYTEPDFTPSNQTESSFLVVATEDNTQIEITPSTNLLGGRLAGVPFTIQLNAGQSAFYTSQSTSSTTAFDVTGTQIQVLGGCKNIAVFAGHTAATVGGCNFYDHLYTQMVPPATWGRNYLLPNLREGQETKYRVYAPTAGTVVTINGVSHSFPRPNGSSVLDTNLATNPAFNPSNTYWLTSTEPVAVMQMSLGANCLSNQFADPLLITLLPIERMLATSANAYTLSFNDGSVSSRSYITILVPEAETGSVTVDGNTLANWQPILDEYPGGNPTGYSARNVDPATQSVRINSNGMLAYAYGYIAGAAATQNAYGYLVAGGFATVPPLRLNVESITENTCFGWGEASATVSVEYGSPPFLLTLDSISNGDTIAIATHTLDNQGSHTFTNLYTYPYTITVSDISCEKSVIVNPTQAERIRPGGTQYPSNQISVCREEPAFRLPDAIPAGGTWSGPGVVPGTNEFWVQLLNQLGNVPAVAYAYYTTVPGCVDSLTINIREDCERLAIPNTFTPNGDGFNDVWLPNLPEVRDYALSIYSRSGQLVFQTNNPLQPWLGDYKGGEAPDGVYFYRVSGTFLTGVAFDRHGSVTLLR